jgi:hypothetical protein
VRTRQARGRNLRPRRPNKANFANDLLASIFNMSFKGLPDLLFFNERRVIAYGSHRKNVQARLVAGFMHSLPRILMFHFLLMYRAESVGVGGGRGREGERRGGCWRGGMREDGNHLCGKGPRPRYRYMSNAFPKPGLNHAQHDFSQAFFLDSPF